MMKFAIATVVALSPAVLMAQSTGSGSTMPGATMGTDSAASPSSQMGTTGSDTTSNSQDAAGSSKMSGSKHMAHHTAKHKRTSSSKSGTMTNGGSTPQ